MIIFILIYNSVNLNKKKAIHIYQALSFTFFYIVSVKRTLVCEWLFYYDISLFFVFKSFENQFFKFFCQFRIVLYANFGCISSLSQFRIIVAIP